MSLQVHD